MDFKPGLVDSMESYGNPTKRMNYGTAGFRDKWNTLHAILNRMGILACVRSLSMNSQYVGLMITASHNDEIDNGIKAVDPNGGMLNQSWEPYAEYLANAKNSEEILKHVSDIVTAEGINHLTSLNPKVIIGRDTRPHSKELCDCATDGIIAFGGHVFDLGEVTTPQLHFVVQHANKEISVPFVISDALNMYKSTLASGFISLLTSCPNHRPISLVVDVAGGVGAISLQQMVETIQSTISTSFSIDIRNHIGTLPVNKGCGAEFVQKSQSLPQGIHPISDQGKLLCSFDGDADRIVFHTLLKQGPSEQQNVISQDNWILLDGDRIAVLFASFLKQELNAANISKLFSLGVVQTAYANGASTLHLKTNDITVKIAKTGVKYLHPVAESFDIGVYFEANGHGTVLFSEALKEYLASYLDQSGGRDPNSREYLAVSRLQASTQAINQAVGDALSDMLFTLAALEIMKMTEISWIQLYNDLPSRQTKVPVADKSLIRNNEDETQAISPIGLQEDLNRAMGSFPMGRCFVRPSGTEDVVRIYAEASSQSQADELALITIELINKFIGVVGEIPTKF